MKQVNEQLIKFRSEYEAGKTVLDDIENQIEELEKKRTDLKEALLKLSDAIEYLEEISRKEQEDNAENSSEADAQTGIQADIEVPFVIRKPIEQARKMIEGKGLSVGEISEKGVFVGGVRFGDVIQQNPKPGTKVEKGSAVNLVLAAKGRFKPNLSKDSKLDAFMME